MEQEQEKLRILGVGCLKHPVFVFQMCSKKSSQANILGISWERYLKGNLRGWETTVSLMNISYISWTLCTNWAEGQVCNNLIQVKLWTIWTSPSQNCLPGRWVSEIYCCQRLSDKTRWKGFVNVIFVHKKLPKHIHSSLPWSWQINLCGALFLPFTDLLRTNKINNGFNSSY